MHILLEVCGIERSLITTEHFSCIVLFTINIYDRLMTKRTEIYHLLGVKIIVVSAR